MRSLLIAGAAGASAAVLSSSLWMPEPTPERVAVREIIHVPAPTTTSTTTTSTTTTTTTTVAPKPQPSKSSLMAKLDQYAPGSSNRYSESTVSAAGKIACQMWNVPNITRFSVIREILVVFENDDYETAAALSQAVLWTVCPITANFPEGPRPFGEWT